ncbi:MAG: hypothetical protein AAFO99_08275 [Bacteroidota bacterium]
MFKLNVDCGNNNSPIKNRVWGNGGDFVKNAFDLNSYRTSSGYETVVSNDVVLYDFETGASVWLMHLIAYSSSFKNLFFKDLEEFFISTSKVFAS